MAGTEPSVALVQGLGPRPCAQVDDGRHGHSDPLFVGPVIAHGPVALGATRDVCRRRQLCPAVVVEGADVGFLAENAVKARSRPLPHPSLGSGYTGLDEPYGNGANRKAPVDVPVEDPPDDGGLFLADGQACRQAVRSRHLAVAKGHLAGYDRALAGPPEFPASVALGDLDPLELGHRGLDLGHQAALRGPRPGLRPKRPPRPRNGRARPG